MSADDGTKAGAPEVENALVAALGFEPTAGMADDPSTVLIDDGSGNALDWSGTEAGSADGSSIDAPGGLLPTDGAVQGPSDLTSTAKVDDSMSPPKGKGKGPRTYRSSRPAADGDGVDGVDSNGSDLGVGFDHDADPAELIDADSSGVRPVDVDFDIYPRPSDNGGIAAETILAEADATGPVPVGSVDQTGPLPAGSFDDQSSRGVPNILDELDEPPPPVADTLSVDAGILGGPLAAQTIITEPPPTPPDSAQLPVGDGLVTEARVTGPPPPLVGDPVSPPGPVIDAAGVAGGAIVTNRAGGPTASKGELAARMPHLLDSGLLKRTRRMRARKVRRVVRHIDPWSVLTFSVLFFLCLFAALLLASVLVWNAAVAAGTIENIESFIREIGDYQTYEIKGDVVFRAAMVIAGILTLAASVMVVLLVVVFNLISDLVGGIRLTVVEEEVVRVRRRRNE
ncbi:MAG: DUF3566 domain-containing protein [Acidimicrobiia bacterium]|nr:DUF3566 domain-containing protein [Acidimicrobiia bacterium]